MLADAFAAERLRFFRARGVLFWSLAFIPLLVIAWNLLDAFLKKAAIARGLPPELADGGQAQVLGLRMAQLIVQSNFPLFQIFFMIAAAAIFSWDYRWETWRFLTPRNTRQNLLLAKVGMFGVAAAAGIAFLGLAGLLVGLIKGGVLQTGISWSTPELSIVPVLAGAFGIAWLEMMVLGAFSALAAVVTRSGVAALIAPVALWMAQAFMASQAAGKLADPAAAPITLLMGLPSLAGDTLRMALQPAQPGFTPPADWPFALFGLLAWIAGLTALAVWQFKRQDLTRE